MNKKLLCLFCTTLLNFSNVNAMNEILSCNSINGGYENSDSNETTLVEFLLNLDSNKFQSNVKRKLKEIQQSIKGKDNDVGLIKIESNINLLKNWLKAEWKVGQERPTEVNCAFDEYNAICNYRNVRGMTKEKIIEMHEWLKSRNVIKFYDARYNQYNKLWMIPHRPQGEIYFVINPGLSLEEREKITKGWKEEKAMHGSQRFGKRLEGKGIFAVEIGNLLAANHTSHYINGEYIIGKSKNVNLKDLLRMIIVWEQDENNVLTKEPKLYLTVHYHDQIDANNLKLIQIEKEIKYEKHLTFDDKEN